ncbi:hypothetical protein lbkm_3584 [Lachnospiraceae bacterium KM106-2]|nr:hypothetical protein lbkm_3584 [Lachnospiraceae bacterium KM106-2]
MKIVIDNKEYSVKLAESRLTKQLETKLPFKEDFGKSGDHEYYTKLSEKLDQKILEDKYIEMYQCMTTKDTTNMANLLDDSFVLVHMTGMRQSKTEYLKYIDQGRLRYYSAQHEHIKVEINGDRAVLIGQSRVSAAVFGGGRHTWSLQQRLQFIDKGGVWLIIESIASTY